MVANNIGKFREAKGWSQQDLSTAAGITRSIISMAENGCYMLEADALGRAAAALGVKVEQLYPPEVMAAVYGIGREKKKRASVRTVNVRISQKTAAELDRLCRAEQIGSRDEAARLVIRLGIEQMTRRDNLDGKNNKARVGDGSGICCRFPDPAVGCGEKHLIGGCGSGPDAGSGGSCGDRNRADAGADEAAAARDLI